jgi:AbrB family looped-hinge helix DNA binding protein
MVVRSTVGPKGQVTIPKELREKYHLLEGENVIVVPSAEDVLIKHPPTSLRGRLKGKMNIQGLEEEMRKIRKQYKIRLD